MSRVERPKQARSRLWAPNLEPEPPAEHPSPTQAGRMGRRAQFRVQAAAGAALLRGRIEAESLDAGEHGATLVGATARCHRPPNPEIMLSST